MGKREIAYEFDYMKADAVMAHVTFYTDFSVGVENFTEDIFDQPFPAGSPDYDSLNRLYERMSMDKGRPDRADILKSMGVPYDTPLSIIKVTRGIMANSPFWIRFKGDTMTFDDLLRRADLPNRYK